MLHFTSKNKFSSPQVHQNRKFAEKILPSSLQNIMCTNSWDAHTDAHRQKDGQPRNIITQAPVVEA